MTDLHDSRPAGSGERVVEQGECISSIARDTGHFWETLWNLDANAALKRARTSPTVLLPGDRLTVPPIRVKTIAVATGKRHVFRRKGVPDYLRLEFRLGGAARAGEPYEATIDGVLHRGTLDENGRLEIALPRGAKGGTVVVGGSSGIRQQRAFRLGTLDPPDTAGGLRSRLENLGFGGAPGDEGLRAAVAALQSACGMEVTGEPDAATLAKIEQLHGA